MWFQMMDSSAATLSPDPAGAGFRPLEGRDAADLVTVEGLVSLDIGNGLMAGPATSVAAAFASAAAVGGRPPAIDPRTAAFSAAAGRLIRNRKVEHGSTEFGQDGGLRRGELQTAFAAVVSFAKAAFLRDRPSGRALLNPHRAAPIVNVTAGQAGGFAA